MSHVIRVAEIGLRRVYTCRKCGAKCEGETASRRFTLTDADTLAQAIKNAANALSAHYMPVGWSSHYAPKADVFQCEACNKDVDKA